MLRDMHAESPNMNYQATKIKKGVGQTWDAKYQDWEHKPGAEHRDDWIASNTKRLVNMARACAAGLAQNMSRRPKWVKDIFSDGEARAPEEEGHEPLGNPVGISAAEGCGNCNEVLTSLNDPDKSGYCKDCAQIAKELDPCEEAIAEIQGKGPDNSPEQEEHIYGYSREKRQAFKSLVHKGKVVSTMYTPVFKGDDKEFAQAKFPGSDPVSITDLTLDEFKAMQDLDPFKGTIFLGNVGGKWLKLMRSHHNSRAYC